VTAAGPLGPRRIFSISPGRAGRAPQARAPRQVGAVVRPEFRPSPPNGLDNAGVNRSGSARVRPVGGRFLLCILIRNVDAQATSVDPDLSFVDPAAPRLGYAAWVLIGVPARGFLLAVRGSPPPLIQRPPPGQRPRNTYPPGSRSAHTLPVQPSCPLAHRRHGRPRVMSIPPVPAHRRFPVSLCAPPSPLPQTGFCLFCGRPPLQPARRRPFLPLFPDTNR